MRPTDPVLMDTKAPACLSTDSFPRGTLIGQRGRYRIERILGKGGFGEAYLAYDTQLDRACVVKRLIMPASPPNVRQRLLDNFQREARLLVTLNTPGHPNVPEIYEYLAKSHCLVMKYIDGRNLDEVLTRRVAPFPETEALRYVRDICSALVYMHSRTTEPVLHRDIKPANIVLDATGRVWLVDFGLAKALSVDLLPPKNRASRIAGTAGYAPPEQWREEAEPRSDVFALLMTLYVLLTFYQPNQTPTPWQWVPLPPVRLLNPAVSPEVERLIQQGTARDVADRPTAQQLLGKLDAILSRAALPPPPEQGLPPPITDCMGRETELAAYTAQLATTHHAIITGPAGVGKTTFAAMLAQQAGDPTRTFWHVFHRDEGVDVVIWDLAAFLARQGQDDLWRLLHHTRQSGAQTPPPELLCDYVIQLVRSQGYLLCLDDLQFVDDDPQFGRLARRLHAEALAGTLDLLVIARRTPAFVPLVGIAPLRGLNAVDTRSLLAAHALALPDDVFATLYATTEGNAQFVTLAIDVLRRADDPARLVDRLVATDDIERYLLAEVDAGLSDQERDVMSAVAILLGHGGTRAAIEAILDRERLQRPLSELCRRHLLTVSENAVARVYNLHAIMQTFYLTQLSKRERLVLHRRAAAFYEIEEIDLLRAAQQFICAGQAPRAARLVAADIWALINEGQARALRQMLEQFTDRQMDAAQWVAVVIARGEVYAQLRESELARASYAEALDRLAAMPDTLVTRERRARVCRGMGELLEYEAPQEALAWLRHGLEALVPAGALAADEMSSTTQGQRMEEGLLRLRIGSVMIATGEHAAAIDALEASLRLSPEGPSQWRARALTNLGVVHCSQGDLMEGKKHFLDALQICRQTHDPWRMVTTWQNLGRVMRILGDWAGAAAEYQKALGLAERLGNVTRQTEIALNLGLLHLKRGDLAAAQLSLTRSLELARRHALREDIVYVQSSMAELQIVLGDWDAVAYALHEAQQLAIELEVKDQLPEIACGWAQMHLARGATAAALECARRAVASAAELGDPLGEGVSLRVLGQVLHAAGSDQDARESFAHSLALLDDRDPYEAARTRMQWGLALLAGDEAARGTALLQEAHATFARLGAQRDLAATAAALGSQRE